ADVSRVVGKMNEKIASVSALSGRTKKIALFVGVCVVVGACAALFVSFRTGYQHTERATFLSADEQSYLDSILDETYTLQRSSALKPLPYPVSPVELDVWAGSAILVDASNGCVIFEKNADTPIPPASITKLFVMYVVFKDIHAGKFSLDDIVPLPEKSWAVNMPADASLMFLGQGQIVTLRELLLGLAVASGNDAAIAVARYISGGTDEFVKRMNDECAALGLTSTRFVEPSGYDENNMTTARDLATFSRIYINTYPESIEMFHSAKSIRYPLEKNLPSWQKDAGDSKAIYQKNTNPLLGEMEGVDGIKTGFIYESGYNLALTAKRNGNRFISITLQGPGRGSKQGNEGRVHDGHEMMDFAFASFADYNPDSHIQTSYPVAVPGGKEKFVRLVPAWKNAITVPHIAGGESANDDANAVRAVVTMPKSIYGGAVVAKQYGQIQYKLGDVVLETVPLVSDRSVERGGLWKRFWGFWI
ncbi:MAG: D-alanyl-D-alanine carboxypeptidase, partial [Treponema sp.]|nr:D-alanyl-D-alanine carboxypeptidase [Treponema sp.]